MAKDVNTVIVSGNATRDAELNVYGGTNVCKFGLAVNSSFGEKAKTDFFDVTCFGKLAEIMSQYLTKGKKVLVEGKLSLEVWEKDGQKRNKVMLIANNITLLSGGQAKEEKSNFEPSVETTEEEVPF